MSDVIEQVRTHVEQLGMDESQNNTMDNAEDINAVFADLKKKKKKKKPEEAAGAEAKEEMPAAETTEATEAKEGGDDAEMIDFSTMKKKKSKKKITFNELAEAESQEQGGSLSASSTVSMSQDGRDGSNAAAWVNTDRDYTYPELLAHIFNLLREKNPELVGERRKQAVAAPQIFRDGKKTIFANIYDVAKRLHRPMDHMISYMYAELSTNGAVDGSQRLSIKGRFNTKQIEIILKNYIKEFVSCNSCKSLDTLLTKENRLYYKTCERCNARVSVATIQPTAKKA